MFKKILVVEDDRDISKLLKMHLEEMTASVEVTHNGKDGYDKAKDGSYDLIILDLMLPGMDGLEICRRLRTSENYVPLLMLTSKSSEVDRVVGLEMGADDYLTKPFSLQELLARVKALYRRVEALKDKPTDTEVIKSGGLQIDTGKRKVTVDGVDVNLTAKEFDLLVQFAKNPGRVYKRDELLDLVWGYGHDGYEHTVNSHMNRLRAKLEKDPAKPEYIVTVWGVGYKFKD